MKVPTGAQMTCSTAKRWKRLFIITALAGALLIAAFFFGTRSSTELLRVEFAGFTNHPGMSHPTALFVISNQSNRTFQLWALREVKTSDWPVYGADMPRLWIQHLSVLQHTSFTCQIFVPDYGNVWRVKFAYADVSTKWEMTRSRWANSLRARGWHRLARLTWSGQKPLYEIVTSEIKSASW